MKAFSESEKILSELRRRYRERALVRYVPSRPQGILHDSDRKIRLYIGANGTGKTTWGIAEASAWCLGERPWNGSVTRVPPCRVAVVCTNFTHSALEDVTPKIEGFLPGSRVIKRHLLANGKVHRWDLDNGSTLTLLSYAMDPADLEGLDYDFVIFNEPPPRSHYVALLRGVSKRNGYLAFAMTPLGSESAWIYDELYAVAGTDPDISQVTATHEDMFMDEHSKKLFYAGLNEDEREARWEGRFRHLVGRVYKEFDSGVHVIRESLLPQVQKWVTDGTIPKGMVIDPHDRKPFAIAWFLINPVGHVIFFKEWPEDEYNSYRSCDYSVPQYAKLIFDTEKNLKISPVIWRLCDPNYGIARRSVTGESIVDRFSELGLSFDAEIHDGLEDGHLAVKEKLMWDDKRPFGDDNCPRLYITPECQNLAYAFSHYCWSSKNNPDGLLKEKVVEHGKDFADLIRYVCVSNLGYFNPHVIASKKASLRYRGVL